MDLYTLIMNFKEPINLKSLILYQHCWECRNLYKSTNISQLPKFLILSLQNENSDNTEKTQWIVKFGLEIRIREIVENDD